MASRTALLLTLVGLAFVALGAIILLRGAPEDRALAIGCIAFFGACAVVGAVELLPKKPLQPDAAGAVTLMPDPAQMLGLVAGGAGMSAGCYYIAQIAQRDGGALVSAVGWFGAVFFALAVPIGLWRLVRPRALARLDRDGVRVFGPNAWSLAWSGVHDIGWCDIHGQRFLVFDAEPAGPSLSDRMNDALGLPRYMLGVNGVAARFEDLEACARALWARAGNR